jgi:hypothetical protein
MTVVQKSRLRVQELTIQFSQGNNVKLMIFRNDRNDTPHLLISWENFSKEVDVHLKSRTAGAREHPNYLAKIPESDFINLFSSFEPTLLQSVGVNLHKIQKVRPGWLGRKGYAVFYMYEDEKNQFINKIISLRRHHGKWEHVFDFQALTDWALSPEAINCVYHPSILHDIAADGHDDAVIASRIKGKHKPKVMPLRLIRKADGKSIWIRLDKLQETIMNVSKTFVLSCLKMLLAREVWATIYNELHLEELGIELS